MRFLVKAVAFETITEPEAIERLRAVFLQKVREITESGKLVTGGHIIHRRGGFFVLDAESGEELTTLLHPLQDYGHIEVEPVESFEALGKVLEENPIR
jgi:muconolactone delta-isomerase